MAWSENKIHDVVVRAIEKLQEEDAELEKRTFD